MEQLKEAHDAVSTQTKIAADLKTSGADKEAVKAATARLDALKNVVDYLAAADSAAAAAAAAAPAETVRLFDACGEGCSTRLFASLILTSCQSKGKDKKGAAPATAPAPAAVAAAAAAPAASAGGDEAALGAAIADKGEQVRKLKADKADKATVEPVVKELLALKVR
jgi:hypothetical protein